MSAGERTWTIYVCAECGKEHRFGSKMPCGSEALKGIEVVELSRLRAAEEERDEALQEVALDRNDRLQAQAWKERAEKALAERDRLAEALKEAWDFLGRDRYYAPPELEKKVREALASLESGDDK